MKTPRNGGRPKEANKDQLVITSNNAVHVAKRTLRVVNQVVTAAHRIGTKMEESIEIPIGNTDAESLSVMKLQCAALQAAVPALTGIMQQLHNMKAKRDETLVAFLKTPGIVAAMKEATLDGVVRILAGQAREAFLLEAPEGERQ